MKWRECFANFVTPPGISLWSPLPIDECRGRLEAAVDHKLTFRGYAGSKPVVGKIDGDRIRLEKRIEGWNSFQPRLFARLIPGATGTFLEGKVHMEPLVMIFAVLWTLGVALAWLAFLALAIRHIVERATDLSQAAIAGAVLTLMVGAGIGMLLLGRSLAFGDREVLHAFLVKALDARETHDDRSETD